MPGTDFPDRQFYPEDAIIIQVDIDGSHIGRRVHVDLGLVGTVNDTITACGRYPTRQRRASTWTARSSTTARPASRSTNWQSMTRPHSDPAGRLARLASQLASDDAVFTYDVGIPTIGAARYLTMNGRRRLIGSATHGSMAGALSHAIGAQSVDRGRQVVALAGDGGMTMSSG